MAVDKATYNWTDESLPDYSVEASGRVRLKIGKEGVEALPPQTVCDVFNSTVAKFGNQLALTSASGQQWTWAEYRSDCVKAAKSLIKLGFEAHNTVNIIGFNTPEWFMADVGAILAGGIAAGIYTTNEADACFYVAEHSDCVVAFCEDRTQLAKFQEIQSKLPLLKALVVYSDEVPEGAESGDIPVYNWEKFMALGDDVADEVVNARMDNCMPNECCTLIYTSGTTGNPKAVMISHDNLTWTAASLQNMLGVNNLDCLVSYLPLSHIAAQMLDIHAAMFAGYPVHFARADALKGTLTTTLKAAQPTIFFGVPRVWEKIMEKMLAVGRNNSGTKKKIAAWAKAKGAAYSNSLQYGSVARKPGCFGCADKIVFSKVKATLGLGRMRYAYTGAAPMSEDVFKYFASLNIQIMDIYGMSECTGPTAGNYTGMWKIGCVGVPIPGTELKIVEGKDDPAGTGEIIFGGRHVFMGYMKMLEKTKESIDDDGYLHSGDVGTIDADGFCKITGRQKELIITAGGENIPPVLIEDSVKGIMSAVSNAVLIGDQRKYLTILLTLKTEMGEDGGPTDQLTGDALIVAKEIGSTAETVSQAQKCPAFNEYFNNGLKDYNKVKTSRAQAVQKWALLPKDFSVPGGELTPTMKLKRPIVHKMYADVIEGLYA